VAINYAASHVMPLVTIETFYVFHLVFVYISFLSSGMKIANLSAFVLEWSSSELYTWDNHRRFTFQITCCTSN